VRPEGFASPAALAVRFAPAVLGGAAAFALICVYYDLIIVLLGTLDSFGCSIDS
jgi:hypothetical protein